MCLPAELNNKRDAPAGACPASTNPRNVCAISASPATSGVR